MMMNVLIEKTEIVQDDLHHSIRVDYKKLKGDIKNQRDENEILYKQLKTVVKETESQRAKIAIFNAKIEELEQHVGILNEPTFHQDLADMAISPQDRSSADFMDGDLNTKSPAHVKNTGTPGGAATGGKMNVKSNQNLRPDASLDEIKASADSRTNQRSDKSNSLVDD